MLKYFLTVVSLSQVFATYKHIVLYTGMISLPHKYIVNKIVVGILSPPPPLTFWLGSDTFTFRTVKIFRNSEICKDAYV